LNLDPHYLKRPPCSPLPLFPFPPTQGKYAKIHKLEFAAALKYARNAKAWIPACAGMTAAG